MKINFARKRIHSTDLGKDAPPWTVQLLDFLNSLGEQAIAALTGGLTFTDNFYAEYVDATFQHGVTAKVKLKRITVAKGAIPLGAVNAAIDYVSVIPTADFDGLPQALVTVYFKSPGTFRAAIVLTSEGVTSGNGFVQAAAIQAPGSFNASRLSGLLWADDTANKRSHAGFHATPNLVAPNAVVAGIGANSAQFAAQTGNVNAQSGGIQGPYTMANLGLVGVAGSGPKLTARIMVTSNAGDGGTRQRRWVGLSDGDLTGVVPVIGSAAQAAKYVAMVVDVAVSPNWILMSGDGTNHSGIDTGIPVVWADTGKGWIISLDWTKLGVLTATLQPIGGAITTLTKTTNIATATLATPGNNAVTTLVGPWVGGVNLAAVAHNYWLSRIFMEGEADSR
jgi:hypothetical protein